MNTPAGEYYVVDEDQGPIAFIEFDRHFEMIWFANTQVS